MPIEKENEILKVILNNTEMIKQKISSVAPLGGATSEKVEEENNDLEIEIEIEEEKESKEVTHPKINLRLKANLKEKLDDLAAEHGMHTATYVRTLCYMAIANSANLQLQNLNMKSELKKLEKSFI